MFTELQLVGLLNKNLVGSLSSLKLGTQERVLCIGYNSKQVLRLIQIKMDSLIELTEVVVLSVFVTWVSSQWS